MFEEEYPTPGLHSLTEHYILLQLSAMGIVSAWVLGGSPFWIIGYLAAMGMLTPIIVEGHRRHGHFLIAHPIKRYCTALIPVWYLIAVYLAGLIWDPSSDVEIQGQTFVSLNPSSMWTPCTFLLQSSWLTMLYLAAVYMAGIGLIFVALTTSLLRRLLVILSVNAVVIAILGFIQLYGGAQEIFWIFEPVDSFFSTFTHQDHFASYALIWTIAFFGLILHLRRLADAENFLEKWGILLLAACGVLACSVCVTGTPLHRTLLGIALGWCIISEATFSASTGKKTGAIMAILSGLALGGAGIVYLGYAYMQGTPLTGLDWAIQTELWHNAWALFLDKPLFGWGVGSYSFLSAMQGEVNLPAGAILTPHSDLLHLLVEQGLLGLVFWTAPLVYLMSRFLLSDKKRLLSAHLWVAVICTLVLALVSFPLQNPACLFSFWLLAGASDAWLRVQSLDLSLETRIVFDHDEMNRIPKLDKPRGNTRSRIEMRNWFK